MLDLVAYNGLGRVIGLPPGGAKILACPGNQLRDQITLSRANISPRHPTQFSEWLITASAGLEKRRPFYLPAEDCGLQYHRVD